MAVPAHSPNTHEPSVPLRLLMYVLVVAGIVCIFVFVAVYQTVPKAVAVAGVVAIIIGLSYLIYKYMPFCTTKHTSVCRASSTATSIPVLASDPGPHVQSMNDDTTKHGVVNHIDEPLPVSSSTLPGSHISADNYFFFVKQRVSSGWKDLAHFLGFKYIDIINIEDRNHDYMSRCMDLLEEWARRNGKSATIGVLMEALSKAGMKRVLDDLKDEFPELATKELFIVHGGEDTGCLVEPLVDEIVDQGVPKDNVYYDKWSIGDTEGIKQSITSASQDRSCKLAVIVISEDMMNNWPREEFGEFLKQEKAFFPIFYGVSRAEVKQRYLPTLADTRGVEAITWERVDEMWIAATASKICKALQGKLA